MSVLANVWSEIGNVGRACVIAVAAVAAVAIARATWRILARAWRRSLGDVITEYAPKPPPIVIDEDALIARLREAFAADLESIKYELRTDSGVSLRQAITNLESSLVHIEGRQAAVERVLADLIGRPS